MGLQHLDLDDALAGLEVVDQQAAAERAERTAVAPGEHPAPLRVAVLDVIADLDAELLALADEIAGSIQRPAFTVKVSAASPQDKVALQIALMGLKDQQDERRWRFNMVGRDGAMAAQWLADRLVGADGPFQALTDAQRGRVVTTAAACRKRLDQALGDLDDQDVTETDLACTCGGRLKVRTGESDFTVQCGKCGRTWTGTALLDGLSAA
jgi:hypothetical protein